MGEQTETTQYKDSVFRAYFKDKGRLLEVYQALTGDVTCEAANIRITDLDGTIGSRVRNDVSFQAGEQEIILIEQQSTLNYNMPLRCFFYLSRLWWKEIEPKMLYNRKAYPVTAPLFAVFYNGREKLPAQHTVWQLSDSFKGSKQKRKRLDLWVDVYDINYGPGKRLLNRCSSLQQYSTLVHKAREFHAMGYSFDESVRMAVRYCIEHDIMKEFLQRHEMEMNNMFSFEYDEKLAMQVAKEEGYEDGLVLGEKKGRKAGREEEKESAAVAMIRKGSPMEFIAEITKLSVPRIMELGKLHGLL